MNARRQIIAALSEDSLGGIATLQDVERAEQLLDTYRADVLAEVTTWLTKKAREERAAGTREDRARADVMASLASKIARGAVRTNNLRMPPADFFEVEHTYQHSAWQFRCDTVTTRPGTGERVALGWFRFSDGEWGCFSATEPEFAEGWTDVTDTTTGDNT